METLHHVMLCAWMDTALHRMLDKATIVKVALRKGRLSPRTISHISISTHYVHMHVLMYVHRHTYVPSEPNLHHLNQMFQLDRALASGKMGP